METVILCKHCDHFIEASDDAIHWPDENFANYNHWEDGDQIFDHDAEPGEAHTLEEWVILRPDLFEEHPDDKIGPNSIYHSRRGKCDMPPVVTGD